MNWCSWYDKYKTVDSILLAAKKEKSPGEALWLDQRHLEFYRGGKKSNTLPSGITYLLSPGAVQIGIGPNYNKFPSDL